jgi:hypothetical protein
MAEQASSTLPSKEVAFWKNEIALWERTADKWCKRGRKLYKRYKDVRSPREEAVTRLNILWSNVQTRLPALYARDPKPEVERRFKDKDPVGRNVAEILERSLDYTISHCNPFGRVMRQAILDYELPGRGTVWVRYLPHFHKISLNEPVSGATEGEQTEGEEVTNDAEDEGEEELHYEETLVDYVYWEDFGHTWARTWDEVRATWRIVYLTRDELKERFGKKAKDVPLDWSPKSLTDNKIRMDQKKAIVYEIWDKQEHEVLWLVKNHPTVLDKKDDPLGLEQFFPCPPPLFANLAADELIPVPNFTFYQDQAMEIDELSTRIAAIGKALKVAGIYDSSAAGIDRLLAEGTENQLIPVEGWAALAGKGGLKGTIELLPLKEIAEALGYLREQRLMMIDDVYQITGMSDIIRGMGEPNETATAQQIKGQFAVLRLTDAQQEVQRFARDTIRIMAQIIAGYDIETLKKISGVKLLTQAEKVQLLGQIAASQQPAPGVQPGLPGGNNGSPGGVPPGTGSPSPAQQQQGGGQPAGGSPPNAGSMSPVAGGTPAPGQQPGNADKIGLLKEPTWEEVAALMENPVLREFKIDIETDSTIRMDEDNEREARMAFIQAVSTLIGEAANVPRDMIPAAGELIMFGIRGFKVARSLERVFEEAIEKLADAPPPPDPEAAKMQAQIQGQQAIAQIKAQTDLQIAQHKAQMDAQVAQAQQASQAQEDRIRNESEAQRSIQEQAIKAQHEQALTDLKQRFESEKVQHETASHERIAAASDATKLQIAGMEQQHDREMEGMKHEHEKAMTGLKHEHEAKLSAQEIKASKKPKD